jgi:hypothetical protein
MLFGIVLNFIVEFPILSNFRLFSILYVMVTTYMKWVNELSIKYSKYKNLKVLIKIKINSFYNKEGWICTTISHHLKANSLIDLLFIFSIFWRSSLLRVVFMLNLYNYMNGSIRSLYFLTLLAFKLIYQVKTAQLRLPLKKWMRSLLFLTTFIILLH